MADIVKGSNLSESAKKVITGLFGFYDPDKGYKIDDYGMPDILSGGNMTVFDDQVANLLKSTNETWYNNYMAQVDFDKTPRISGIELPFELSDLVKTSEDGSEKYYINTHNPSTLNNRTWIPSEQRWAEHGTGKLSEMRGLTGTENTALDQYISYINKFKEDKNAALRWQQGQYSPDVVVTENKVYTPLDSEYGELTDTEEQQPQKTKSVVINSPMSVVNSTSPEERRSGVDLYTGMNYSPAYEQASAQLGMNPLNWSKYIKPSYWNSDIHKAVREGGNIAATMTALPFAAYAGVTASPWLWSTARPFIMRHVVAPTIAGTAWDEAQRAITGTTTTEQISNWLQENRGWNPMAADFVGSFSNPGYWINFAGAGKYTAPLLNTIGLGAEKAMMPAAVEASLNTAAKPSLNFKLPELNVSESVSKAKQATVNGYNATVQALNKGFDATKTAVVNGANSVGAALDRNLYKLQGLADPYLLFTKSKTRISPDDLPRFEFVTDPSQLNPVNHSNASAVPTVHQYLKFPSQKFNDKVFGPAFNLKMPKLNLINYYNDGLSGITRLDHEAISPLAAGLSTTDIAFGDNDNPTLRGIEYALLGRYGLQKLVDSRIVPLARQVENYVTDFNKISQNMKNFFQDLEVKMTAPKGFTKVYRNPNGLPPTDNTTIPAYVTPLDVQKKPLLNINKASFDDLAKYVTKNTSGLYSLRGLTVSGDKIYGSNGQVVARRGANGKIEIINEMELRASLAEDINITDFKTGKNFTGKIEVGDDGSVTIPQEYTDILRSNIDYVQNQLFPGSGIKVFGSSAGVTEAGFPHATHDIDFYITQKQMDAIRKANPSAFSPRESSAVHPDDVDTWIHRIEGGKFGDSGDIDLNVIKADKNGFATGERAEELFRQYFPDEYMEALRNHVGGKTEKLVISKTPEELLEAMNPSSKTIMDSFDINYLANNAKAKHGLRSWTHLVYSDPQQVAAGLQQYAQSMLGSRVKMFPMSVEQLGDAEVNRQALQKLGIQLAPFEMDRIVNDPQRMKNVLDAWYLMDNTAMRAIEATWPGVKGTSPNNLIKSATLWHPTENGGNQNGAGLNVTIGGDSLHGGVLKAFISPRQEYKSKDLLSLIDEINDNFGRNPQAPSILYSFPLQGKEAARGLFQVYKDKGWNFLQNGGNYGNGSYASATRPFDVDEDFVGFARNKIFMNPMVTRVNNSEANPITRSTTSSGLYSYKRDVIQRASEIKKPGKSAEILGYNKNRFKYHFRDPMYYDSAAPKWVEPFAFSILPTLTGIAVGSSAYNKYSRNNWVNEKIQNHDEVIQRMNPQERQMFTKEGVEELRRKIEQQGRTNPDDISAIVYAILMEKYEQYQNKD